MESEFTEHPVFVTPVDVFVGTHLTKRIVEVDSNVHMFTRPMWTGKPGSLASTDTANLTHHTLEYSLAGRRQLTGEWLARGIKWLKEVGQ